MTIKGTIHVRNTLTGLERTFADLSTASELPIGPYEITVNGTLAVERTRP